MAGKHTDQQHSVQGSGDHSANLMGLEEFLGKQGQALDGKNVVTVSLMYKNLL